MPRAKRWAINSCDETLSMADPHSCRCRCGDDLPLAKIRTISGLAWTKSTASIAMHAYRRCHGLFGAGTSFCDFFDDRQCGYLSDSSLIAWVGRRRRATFGLFKCVAPRNAFARCHGAVGMYRLCADNSCTFHPQPAYWRERLTEESPNTDGHRAALHPDRHCPALAVVHPIAQIVAFHVL